MDFITRRMLLRAAILNRDLDGFKKLTTKRVANPDRKDEVMKLYWLAVHERDYKLLEIYYDKLPTDRFIFELIEKGTVGDIQFCVESDATFINRMLHGYPLHLCTEFNRVGNLLYLLRCGADVNKTRGLYSETPLHVACNLSRFSILNILCKNKNIEINKRNSTQETALHLVCKCDQLLFVKMLLKTSIDVNLLDYCGDSAFATACASDSHTIVTYLWSQKDKLNLHIDENNEHIRNYKIKYPNFLF